MASGSVQKNFGPMHLKQIKLVCAPLSVISSFEAICHPLFEKVIQNRARIDNIVSLRDTLLPRLISGQLRLPDVEA
jgi:type I restriction enzyme S subunit